MALSRTSAALMTVRAVHTSHFLPSIPADLPLDTRRRLIQSLERWHFEPHKLRDDEVLSCALILFEGLFRIEGMEEATGVTMGTLYLSLNP